MMVAQCRRQSRTVIGIASLILIASLGIYFIRAGIAPVKRPVLQISADATPFARWNGSAIADPASLEQKLAELAAQMTHPEIQILPDRDVSYQRVEDVMKIVQQYGISVGLIGNMATKDAENSR